MQLDVVHAGNFKLDGGAMFGVVPKKIWQKLNPPDDDNLCTWAMRLLLIQVDDRKILIDTGIGDKQSDKFFSYYKPHGDQSIDKSLDGLGLTREDITDVFITHMHFDHVGGAIMYDEDENLVPAFPNATYWTNETHWEWATNPNAREKASFLEENIVPIKESGQMEFTEHGAEPFPNVTVQYVYGHTEAMMVPHIQYGDQHIVYAADLMPSRFHFPLPFVMAYDMRPLYTLEEKDELLKTVIDNEWILFFEHDPEVECCTVQQGKKYPEVKEAFQLSDIT